LIPRGEHAHRLAADRREEGRHEGASPRKDSERAKTRIVLGPENTS
jgi:hypothetical protein